MAFPKNLSAVSTNLDPATLEVVVRAVENQQVRWVQTASYFESNAGIFVFEGNKYSLEEIYEYVTSVMRLGKASFEEAKLSKNMLTPPVTTKTIEVAPETFRFMKLEVD